jgi:hypothetical protein
MHTHLTECLAVTFEFSVRMGLLGVEDLFDGHGPDSVFAIAALRRYTLVSIAQLVWNRWDERWWVG